MAETKLQDYTVQEKLNKMDADIITVRGLLYDSGYADGDIMMLPIEIPNCVSVNGGTALLHSVTTVASNVALANEVASGDGTNAQGPMTLIFQSKGDMPDDNNTEELSDPVSSMTNFARADAESVCGIIQMTSPFDVGKLCIQQKINCGLMLQAEPNSKSLWVWAMANNNDNYTGATLSIRVGVIKD